MGDLFTDEWQWLYLVLQTAVLIAIALWLANWGVTRFLFAFSAALLIGLLLAVSTGDTGIPLFKDEMWGDCYDISMLVLWLNSAMLSAYDAVRNKQEADRGPSMSAMQRALMRRHNNRMYALKMGWDMFDPADCEDCEAEHRYCGHGPELSEPEPTVQPTN